MENILFYILSSVAIIFAILVIVKNEPIASALSLTVSFLAMAGIFILLNAFFLGTMQVLVYSGAIMVLFVFIIMLFESKLKISYNLKLVGLTVFFFIIFTLQVIIMLSANTKGKESIPSISHIEKSVSGSENVEKFSDVKVTGKVLFQKYGAPIIGVSIILLIATIGVTNLNITQKNN